MRAPTVSSMITTSAWAMRTPLTITCKSSPADCCSRTTLPRSRARQRRSEIWPVPSTTSTGQVTSRNRANGSPLPPLPAPAPACGPAVAAPAPAPAPVPGVAPGGVPGTPPPASGGVGNPCPACPPWAPPGSELDDEIREENIGDLERLQRGRRLLRDRLLQFGLAFGGDEMIGGLLRQEIEQLGSHAGELQRVLPEVIELVAVADDQRHGDAQKPRGFFVGQVDGKGIERQHTAVLRFRVTTAGGFGMLRPEVGTGCSA